jgi:rhamnosyltransferase
MYRGSYFREVGGFKDGLIMNEDMEFAARAIHADKKVAYTAEARVYHSHMFPARVIFMRYFDIGVFFRTNQEIAEYLKEHEALESAGKKQVTEELQYLYAKDKSLLPKSLWLIAVKYAAFKLGSNYRKIPKPLRKILSLHKNWHLDKH